LINLLGKLLIGVSVVIGIQFKSLTLNHPTFNEI